MPRSFGRPITKLCYSYLFYFDARTTPYTNNFGPFVKFKQWNTHRFKAKLKLYGSNEINKWNLDDSACWTKCYFFRSTFGLKSETTRVIYEITDKVKCSMRIYQTDFEQMCKHLSRSGVNHSYSWKISTKKNKLTLDI